MAHHRVLKSCFCTKPSQDRHSLLSRGERTSRVFVSLTHAQKRIFIFGY